MDSARLVATLRSRRGLTQEQLAHELGVSFSTVNAWERGRSQPRRPRRLQLEELVDATVVPDRVRVLVIDDDPIGLAVFEGHLAGLDRDLDVVTASTGIDGLLAAGGLRPHVVFLDVMMPGLDGFDVADRIAANAELSSATVVLVTAAPSPAVVRRAEGAPVLRVLGKPVSATDLERVLDHVDEQRRIRST